MTTGKRARLLILLAALSVALIIACGGGEDTTKASEAGVRTPEQVKKDIQATLDEVIERFKYYDKSALYEMELEYYRDQVTYGEYLDLDAIRYFNPDSVQRIIVEKIDRLDEDTAKVDVKVMFVGPLGDTSYDTDNYTFFYQNGRWIKPTVTSNYAAIGEQQKYEEVIRQADSAAKAEAEEGMW